MDDYENPRTNKLINNVRSNNYSDFDELWERTKKANKELSEIVNYLKEKKDGSQ